MPCAAMRLPGGGRGHTNIRRPYRGLRAGDLQRQTYHVQRCAYRWGRLRTWHSLVHELPCRYGGTAANALTFLNPPSTKPIRSATEGILPDCGKTPFSRRSALHDQKPQTAARGPLVRDGDRRPGHRLIRHFRQLKKIGFDLPRCFLDHTIHTVPVTDHTPPISMHKSVHIVSYDEFLSIDFRSGGGVAHG